MNVKNKINIIEKTLDLLYPNPTISLYYTNEYTLLLAIILTAKSKEKRVNHITKELFKIISSPLDFINLDSKIIKHHIRHIGLYNKKYKSIYNLSIILIKKYKKCIPKNIIDLEKLPGVGHKTASVFLSYISDNNFFFPIDTHIHRLMKRWKLSCGSNVKKTEKDAKYFFAKKNWKKLHIQMILYGRTYSPSRKWIIKNDIIYQKLLHYNLL
ncbi:endonuclease III domain-containing protein [Blattabacterium cuenoti]|uniref:endonuclease III domain-containing protein n=1 Tax=Blattabacterium cuenoti TaxID=1653831 RepID=UPI00163C4999|nr:endonuclease III [Blattabacterium cuenoti]